MEEKYREKIDRIYRGQNEYFYSQETKDPAFRIKQLKKAEGCN